MIRALFAFAFWAQAAAALDLDLPERTTELAREAETSATIEIAVGAYENGLVPQTKLQGDISRIAFRIDGSGSKSDQIVGLFDGQLLAQGYETVFRCAAVQCGGFDFRFALPGFRAPILFIDLTDFTYLVARKSAGGAEDYVTLLASVSPNAGYVEVTTIGATPLSKSSSTTQTTNIRPLAPTLNGTLTGFDDQFESEGRVVLEDLVFRTGSAELEDQPFASLASLSSYLESRPTRSIALVGHTDSEGSLNGNISLSQRRAQAVLELLVERFDIPRERLRAEGMGYLAPRASNLTEEGRRQNRRVEAIITSTE